MQRSFNSQTPYQEEPCWDKRRTDVFSAHWQIGKYWENGFCVSAELLPSYPVYLAAWEEGGLENMGGHGCLDVRWWNPVIRSPCSSSLFLVARVLLAL